jgi:hypothetical protein
MVAAVPAFPKPHFRYDYDPESQIAALRQWRDTAPDRQIPAKAPQRLLVATWNIANLGRPEQVRREKDYRVIAEIISWFDVAAIQEVNADLSGLRGVMHFLPPSYKAVFCDPGGNDERLAFLYEAPKVSLLEEIGEVGIPPSDIPDISLPGIRMKFKGFDRNPFLATFSCAPLTFGLVNVHLYFGSEIENAKASIDRRSLEAYAVARWADLRRESPATYTPNIVALGDFNLPKADPEDPVYKALTRRGLRLPEHSTQMGSSIRRDRHYDQVLFFPPGETELALVEEAAVFDYDNALFKTLWEKRGRDAYFEYVRYYISDHRLLWAELHL